MPLYIYNSLTRKKEEFIPLNPPQVNIYTCGVTVYDACHIGHARSLYLFEVMRRYLCFKGFKVNFARNITDIDDKIINRSRELNRNWRELVAACIESYYVDMESLGIAPADVEPRATDNIPGMITYIAGLIAKGFAYEAGGDVYFSVRNFKEYGKLSGQGIDQMETGVRIEPAGHKKDPLDFALWKKSKENEPFWLSPWGNGRPGWHIECSMMSQKFLKAETLDIHAGGRDLIFPHHENEIAQAEALTGKPFSKYWIHHGLLTINGHKMSKSLGNFVTIKDFIARFKDADLLKLFFLSAHYTHPIDYTEDKIQEAGKQRASFNNFFDKAHNWRPLDAKSLPSQAPEDMQKVDALCNRFIAAMDDDFNTPQALAGLFELIDLGARLVSADKQETFNYLEERLAQFLSIFCLQVKPKKELPARFLDLITLRIQAKANKDFKDADRLRKEFEDKANCLIVDTANGVSYIDKE